MASLDNDTLNFCFNEISGNVEKDVYLRVKGVRACQNRFQQKVLTLAKDLPNLQS